MAVYTYCCENCKQEFEVERSINDNSKVVCNCGSENVKRVYKNVGVNLRFEGSFNNSRK